MADYDATRKRASRASSHHDGQADAQTATTRESGSSGGGEVRSHGTGGRIRNTTAIAEPDPDPPRERRHKMAAHDLALATSSSAAGAVVDPAALATRAAEVAARQRSPETRRTYAAVYRAFVAFLGPDAVSSDVTAEAVRAYRDALERTGRSPATVAKHLSALRGLADALGVDTHQLRTVRSARVERGQPRALTHDEWQRLLRMPDRRTRQGKRDLALLHLLGSAGLRRAEAARLLLTDVDERRRASDPQLRQAIKSSTSWWTIVSYGKRGRTRAIPLDEDALEAIAAWVKSRPTAATEHLLLSLPRTGQPKPLSTRDIARIVARHAAAAALPEDRRSPHILRHTFCTHLADTGADTAVIRELAGHADIRTTTIYTAVNRARLEHAIAERGRHNRGARRAAASA